MNPFLFSFNQAIDFQNITKENIEDITAQNIANLSEQLQNLYQIPVRTFDNTMLAYDALTNQLSVVTSVLFLLSSTLTDDDLRNKSRKAVEELEKFGNQLSLDENLYQAIKAYSQTAEAQTLTAYKHKLLTETVRSFEKNGFALPKEKREELQKIQDQLSEQNN